MHRNAKNLGLGVLTMVAGVMAALTIPPSRALQAAAPTAGTAPVTVMNTPLPVALQGTGTITGQVTATQEGAWSVGVTSLPAVQLAPGTTVNVQGGGAGDSARQAYALELCATGTESCPAGTSFATLPLNTRFVIEYVSGSCRVTNTGIHGWTLTGPLNGQPHTYQVQCKISAEDDHSTTGLFSEQVRIYVDGGATGSLSVGTHDQGFSQHHDLGPYSECGITLSGYLVDTTPVFPSAR